VRRADGQRLRRALGDALGGTTPAMLRTSEQIVDTDTINAQIERAGMAGTVELKFDYRPPR
jgi:hypothetical protein